MHISIKQAVLGNSFLKISSLLIAYIFWSIVGESYPSSLWISLPVCFYNNEKNIEINAPELVNVQLKGRRSALYSLDFSTLAIHIDIHELKQGPNSYMLTSNNLLLPLSVALGTYTPSNFVITLSYT